MKPDLIHIQGVTVRRSIERGREKWIAFSNGVSTYASSIEAAVRDLKRKLRLNG